MNEYTASNGITIRFDEDGYLIGKQHRVDGGREDLHATASPDLGMDALREFFRYQEDDRLSRWRWPENPEYVVYLSDDGQAVVLHEPTAQTVYRYRGEAEELRRELKRDLGPASTAAEAYSDAHQPAWHSALPGESWALVYLNEEVPAVASSSESGHIIFTASTNQGGGTDEFRTDSKHITAGHRIWPES